jgi:hypothetical protein
MFFPLGFLFVREQVFVHIKVEEENTNLERLSAFGVGCQPVHQLLLILPQFTTFFSKYARSKVVARVKMML